MLQMK